MEFFEAVLFIIGIIVGIGVSITGIYLLFIGFLKVFSNLPYTNEFFYGALFSVGGAIITIIIFKSLPK